MIFFVKSSLLFHFNIFFLFFIFLLIDIFDFTILFLYTLLRGDNLEDLQDNNNFHSFDSSESVQVSIDEINDMHVILNDSDCSDTFFDDVCSFLSNQGLHFDITRNSIDIDEDDYTIITLDQQYNSGFGSLIFAPFDNTRLGDSDSLALAVMAAMKQNEIVVDDIISGKVGFRADDVGNVSTLVPTEAEEKIDVGKSTSFVTISLGTQNTNFEMVGRSIINALMRQKYYLDHFDSHTDLLYRADSGEAVPMVAEYFGSTVDELSDVNNLKDQNTLEAQTIINPNARNIASFNSSIIFQLVEEKSKSL